jgi:stage III sporulation protein AG
VFKKFMDITTNNQYMVLIILAGILAMIIGPMFGKDENEGLSIPTVNESDNVAVFGKKPSSPQTMAEYEDHYENELKEILEDAVGISDVSVMINLDATEAQVHAFNTKTQTQNTDEIDSQNGKRKVKDQSTDKQVVILRSGDTEKPIIVRTEKPVVRGVIIVAKGAENIQVKQWIIEAVTRVLNVPPHKISVLPKK